MPPDFAQLIYGTAQNAAQDAGKGMPEAVAQGAQIGLQMRAQDQAAITQAASIAQHAEELQLKKQQLQQKNAELAQAKLGKLYDYVKEARNYDTASARNNYLKSALGYRNTMGIDPKAIPDEQILSLGMDENMGRFATLDMEVGSGRMDKASALKIMNNPQALAQVVPMPADITKTPDMAKTEKEFLVRQSQERQAAYKAGLTIEQIQNQKQHLNNVDTLDALKAQQDVLKTRLEVEKEAERRRQSDLDNLRKDKEFGLKEKEFALKARQNKSGMSKALESRLASKYADYAAGGGRSGIEASLSKLEDVAAKLESGQVTTGGLSTFIPGANSDVAQTVLNPGMVDAKIQAQSALNNVLRSTLGAQFTAKEGERVLSQIWDDKQTPAVNAKRVRSKITELRSNVLSAETEFKKAGFMDQQEGSASAVVRSGEPKTFSLGGKSFTETKLRDFLSKHPNDPQAATVRKMLGGK